MENKTNYIDMKAKMVSPEKNTPPDRAENGSTNAKFGQGGKITASRGVLGS